MTGVSEAQREAVSAVHAAVRDLNNALAGAALRGVGCHLSLEYSPERADIGLAFGYDVHLGHCAVIGSVAYQDPGR